MNPDKTANVKEEEDTLEEEKIDKDDPEKLTKMRNWDDWKDGKSYTLPAVFLFWISKFFVREYHRWTWLLEFICTHLKWFQVLLF